MPIYDYRCSSCGESFEALTGPDEKITCVKCKSKKVKRLLCAPGHVGISSKDRGFLKCGKDTTCCGSHEPCSKPGCHK
jgi:putative FmdB family regulatory protein